MTPAFDWPRRLPRSICVVGLHFVGRVRSPGRRSPPRPTGRSRWPCRCSWSASTFPGQALDDTISQRCLETFIKELDPLKLFFYQSDVDEFMQQPHPLGRSVPARRHPIRVQRVRAFPVARDERINMAHGRVGQAARFHRRRGNDPRSRSRDVSPKRPKRRPSAGGNA